MRYLQRQERFQQNNLHDLWLKWNRQVCTRAAPFNNHIIGRKFTYEVTTHKGHLFFCDTQRKNDNSHNQVNLKCVNYHFITVLRTVWQDIWGYLTKEWRVIISLGEELAWLWGQSSQSCWYGNIFFQRCLSLCKIHVACYSYDRHCTTSEWRWFIEWIV